MKKLEEIRAELHALADDIAAIEPEVDRLVKSAPADGGAGDAEWREGFDRDARVIALNLARTKLAHLAEKYSAALADHDI